MLNTVFLVGRVNELSEDSKYTDMQLIVSRNYKNEYGIYEFDNICVKTTILTEQQINYIKPNNVIGIKGRLQMLNNELVVIADRITFLKSNGNEEID